MPFRAVTVEGVGLLCFPPHDRAFQTIAMRLFPTLEDRTPGALQAALARTYPRATVRARADLASLGPAAGVWYVYRDGRFSPFSAGDRWWDDDAHARIVIGDDGRYLDANEAALALMGTTRAGLLASRTGDFTTERFAQVVPWVWDLLRQTGELHSTSILLARDGRELAVEFHLSRDGDGPGRHVSVMREVPLEAADASEAGARERPDVTARADGEAPTAGPTAAGTAEAAPAMEG